VNYGLYWFNPGPVLASDANPNQKQKFNTYSWKPAGPCNYCTYNPATDSVTLTASALQGAIQVDPNLKNSYSNQVVAFLERQLTEGLGAHVGYTWLAMNNQYGVFQPYRPASAYTVPFDVTDPVTGNALREYGIPGSAIAGCTPSITTPTANCLYPVTQVEMNQPNNGSYKTVEVSATKRMSHHFSGGGGYGYTWINDYPQGYPNTPNAPGRNPYSFYSLKATGQFELKYGILLSAVYRFQAGQNYARLLTITAANSANCNCTWSGANGGPSPGSNNFPASSLSTSTVFATPFNAYRQDNLSTFDLRGEKVLNLTRGMRVRLFLDGYNLFNSYAAEQISYTTGSGFQVPASILGPRTGRIGFRFEW